MLFRSATSRWWRVRGRFVFEPDLHRYPFDTQRLPLRIERVNEPADELLLVADTAGSGTDAELHVPGWSIGPLEASERVHEYPVLGTAYSQVAFAIPLERDALANILKHIAALAIFVLLGAATLILARNDYQIRVGGTALVGLTVFYLATSSDVVAVGYLTLGDLAVIVAYASLFLVLVCGMIGAWQFLEGRYEGPEGAARSKRLRMRFLALVTAVYVIGTGAVIAVGLAG